MKYIIENKTKICCICGGNKSLVDFHKRRAGKWKGNPLSFCKKCNTLRMRAKYIIKRLKLHGTKQIHSEIDLLQDMINLRLEILKFPEKSASLIIKEIISKGNVNG